MPNIWRMNLQELVALAHDYGIVDECQPRGEMYHVRAGSISVAYSGEDAMYVLRMLIRAFEEGQTTLLSNRNLA